MPVVVLEGLQEVEHPYIRAKHPVLTPDARAWFNGQWGWAWFVAHVDGSVDWDVVPDFEGPCPEWFGWVTEGVPWLDRLFGHDVAAEMMQRGIAPGQPFRIAFSYHCGIDYHATMMGEGWDEFHWELLEVEPLDADEAANRWSAWLDAWMEGYND